MIPRNKTALLVLSLMFSVLSFSRTHSRDSIDSCAQCVNITVTTKDIHSDRVYLANNSEYCPVTLKLQYQGHMKEKMGKEFDQILLPSRSAENELITIKDFTQDDREKMTISYIFGDVLQEEYDKDFVYKLPYPIDAEYEVIRSSDGGYLKSLDHAIDIKMPLLSQVCAARSGTVVMVVSDKIANCSTIMCPDLGNFILIYHEDGSFAIYGHLLKNSSQVKVGDIIDAGQVIANSGNTGWSTGMQLHFQVFLSDFDRTGKTIRPKFSLSPNSEAVYLEYNQYYKRLK